MTLDLAALLFQPVPAFIVRRCLGGEYTWLGEFETDWVPDARLAWIFRSAADAEHWSAQPNCVTHTLGDGPCRCGHVLTCPKHGPVVCVLEDS